MLTDEKIKEVVRNSAGGNPGRYFPYVGTTYDLCRAIEAAVREEMAKGQEPVAWRYWKDKFGCWEYDEAKLEFPAVPAGTKMHPLYAAPVVPDDMVMVPREPSDQMIHAAKRNGAEGSDEEIASDYRAMIAAAEKQK